MIRNQRSSRFKNYYYHQHYQLADQFNIQIGRFIFVVYDSTHFHKLLAVSGNNSLRNLLYDQAASKLIK